MKKTIIVILTMISIVYLCGCDKSVEKKEDLELKEDDNISEQSVDENIDNDYEEENDEITESHSENSINNKNNSKENTNTNSESYVEKEDKKKTPSSKEKAEVITPIKNIVEEEKEDDSEEQYLQSDDSSNSSQTHSHIEVGNMGWFNTQSELEAACMAELDKWGKLWETNQISDDEYFSKCPSGYEGRQCSCGKWTGDYKYNN